MCVCVSYNPSDIRVQSPLSLGGPITPRVFPTPGTAVWALVDNVSIVLGDITPEEIKASLDSSAPVDVVPSVLYVSLRFMSTDLCSQEWRRSSGLSHSTHHPERGEQVHHLPRSAL